MRYSRVPPVQPHRWLSVVTSDTAHQTHLNKFIGLGTWQNASLRLKKKKKKSLQATAKSTIWYDRCSSGKLIAIEVPEGGRIGRVPGKGEGVSGPCPRGREESELAFLESSSQTPSCVENGSSVIPLPDWCTWGTRCSAQTFAGYYWTQHPASSMCDSQTVSAWADRRGTKRATFSSPRLNGTVELQVRQRAEDKRGPTLAAGWARGWGSGPCLRRAAKQEGLTTRIQLLVYEQRLCFCLVADPAALTVVSGTTCCHKAVEAKNRGTCLDVTNLLCHPWQRFTQEVWQWSR